MIVLIQGSSHSGKTLLAQKLLEKYHYPYLSIDHLKMGLIRTKYTNLTPYSTEKELTNYLWPIIKEIIKTAIENKQNLIIEGCYIPFNYKKYFKEEYQREIKFTCLIFSTNYIEKNFETIKNKANIIEKRLDEKLTKTELFKENSKNLKQCQKYSCNYILIDNEYDFKIDL